MSCKTTYDPCLDGKLNQIGSYSAAARYAAEQSATSATQSANSATASATSATNSATSATQANNYLTQVENIFEDFDERYLGSKAVAPTVDNQGNPLQEGAMYWNSVANSLYVWDGSVWVALPTGFNEFTNFLATGTPTARNLVTRGGDVINVKDFGAVGDGVTDDAAAIQAAMNFGGTIYFPEGTYIVSQNISVTDKRSGVIGAHPTKTIFSFSGSSAGFTFNSGTDSSNTFLIENIQLIKSNQNSLDSAIKIIGKSGLAIPTVSIANVNINGQWKYGVYLEDVALSNFNKVTIDVSQTYTDSCFRITGQSIDNSFNSCSCFSSQIGFNIDGVGEGVLINNCTMVNVIVGIRANHQSTVPPKSEPWLSVSGTHINANSRCIVLVNVLQSIISGCLFYAGIGNSGVKEGWIGVDVSGGDGAVNEEIVISNNIFNGRTYPDPSMIGVSINTGNSVVVSGNMFIETVTGIYAGTDCLESKFTDNLYRGLANSIINTGITNSHYFTDQGAICVNNIANGLKIEPNVTSGSPTIRAYGSDENININLATKGSGLISFGTFTEQGATPTTGFIEILDAAGTPRKIAVIS